MCQNCGSETGIRIILWGMPSVEPDPDGINWTSRARASANNFMAVAYGGGEFVAVANSGTGTRVMTSTQ